MVKKMADKRAHKRLVSKRINTLSRVQQDFKNEVDINSIVERHKPQKERKSRYVNLSDVDDFFSANMKVLRVKEAFMSLPAKIRERFRNNPQNLMDFLADPKNKEEAIELGILMGREKAKEEIEKEEKGGKEDEN